MLTERERRVDAAVCEAFLRGCVRHNTKPLGVMELAAKHGIERRFHKEVLKDVSAAWRRQQERGG